jgi:hypothetical protein
MPNEMPADKGEYKGSCNRRDCLAPNAIYYNLSTRKHYCVECAVLLNDVNKADAQEMFGGPLCVDVTHPEHPHHVT